ncbi:MAG: hypothetical protein LBF68_01765 [Christensenellaceae bacterium]|jgi:cell division protein FtsB|nr:hypothetical protein [Christensenellaceae bacterium]
MIKELRRIISSKATLSVIILLILVIFILSCIQFYNSTWQSGLAFKKYTSFDELSDRITTINQEISELKKDNFDYSQRIEDLKDQLRFIEFLIENKIDYTYLDNNIRSATLTIFAADAVDHTIVFSDFAVIGLIIVMLTISVVTLNLDFSTGVARLLYALRKNRSKILTNKYFAYMSLIGILSLLFTFIIFIVGLPYKSNFSQVLIIDATKIYLMNSSTFLAINIVSMYLVLLFISTIVFSISMCFKSVYASVFTSLLFIIGYFVLSYTTTGWFSSFFTEIMSYYLTPFSFGIFFIFYITRYIMSALFFILARKHFLSRDIS